MDDEMITEIAEPKSTKPIEMDCSISSRKALFYPDTGNLLITQGEITVASYVCVSEEHAQKVAAKF
tara:strand:- start:3585 stop:3782 length:198 start_codon:yes stop_codon:yes gene_type:complete